MITTNSPSGNAMRGKQPMECQFIDHHTQNKELIRVCVWLVVCHRGLSDELLSVHMSLGRVLWPGQIEQ